MWTLVRKDLILDRRTIGLNFAIYLVMGPVFLSLLSEAPIRMVAAWAGIVGSMIPLSLVGREDKFNSATLTCSLPVTRDMVVASRFVGGWLTALGGALAILAACNLTALAGLGELAGGWSGALLAAFVTTGLLMAGLMPFTLRFGLAGLIGFLVATQLLGIVAFLAAALFGAHGALRAVIGGIAGALQVLRGAVGEIAYPLSLITVVVVLNVVSFLLSRWIYRRREL
jgi:ABC-type transport system involved in multi-copper enzyme maturation permease subunit